MTAGIAFAALAIILPISALIARRLPPRRIVGLALAWVAIFAIAYLVATWWYA